MKNLNPANQKKGKLKKIEKILDPEYISALFVDNKDNYFPLDKKRSIENIDIKRQSPEWVTKSCLAKYKITFSGGIERIVRATAYIDGSKKEVFGLMKIVYQHFNDGEFQIPRAVDYRDEAKALFYEEAPGTPLAIALEQEKPSPKIFKDVAVFLAKFHSLKKTKNSAVILGKSEYQKAFKRIVKILPELEKEIPSTKNIPFLKDLKDRDTFIHGDLYSGNVVIGKKNVTYFIDLDKAGCGSIFLDLAPLYFSLEFPGSIWKIKYTPEEIEKFRKALLETYCKEREINLEETRENLERFKSKIFLDALHFVVGFAYNGWPTIDEKAKKSFKIKIQDLLKKINQTIDDKK